MRRPKGPGRLRAKQLRRRIGGQWWAAWWQPWKGLGQWTHYPRHSDAECAICRPWSKGEDAMKKPSVSQHSGTSGLSRVETPKSLAKLPTIAELLVQPAWEDGEGKGERSVFVFVSATLVKLLVKVECPPLKLMVNGRAWDEAWAALETCLRGDDVPWEQDTPRQPQGQKKRKPTA